MKLVNTFCARTSRTGRMTTRVFLLPGLAVLFLMFGLSAWAQSSGGSNSGSGGANGQQDWSAVQNALGGWKGEVKPSGVLVVELENQSLGVNVRGNSLKPGMLAHGFLAFSSVPNGASAAGGATGSSSSGGATMAANTLVVGEFPCLSSEVSVVVQAFARQSITVSAVHKHVFEDNPRLAFVHIEEAGDGATLAQRIRTAVGTAGLKLSEESKESTSSVGQSLDLGRIRSTLGAAAPLSISGANSGNFANIEPVQVQASNGILEVVIPRAEQFSSCAQSIFNARMSNTQGGGGTAGASAGAGTGMTAVAGAGNNRGTVANQSNLCLGGSLVDQAATAGAVASGAGSGAANYVAADALGASYEFRFQPIGSKRAIVVAEMPLLVTEVRDVERILADAGIQVLFGEAHNHTLSESPRLLFMHATAVGDPAQIAEVFRAAISNSANVAAGQQSIVNQGK